MSACEFLNISIIVFFNSYGTRMLSDGFTSSFGGVTVHSKGDFLVCNNKEFDPDISLENLFVELDPKQTIRFVRGLIALER